MAPDFSLEPARGGAPVRLLSFRGTSRVALVFASYTWPPFRSQVGTLNAMAER